MGVHVLDLLAPAHVFWTFADHHARAESASVVMLGRALEIVLEVLA